MLLLFALTLFVSAFLLFLVQPMIAQMILPLLGGTPAVWNTCMVFFQAALLAGYGYTHSATTYMPVKRQTVMQGGLLVLPFLFFLLPFSIGNWVPATEVNPIWSVLFILLISVGLPFFVVATSAPLLQRWFASTGHPASKDPYFLYGASNLGSMLALVSYPFVFQPSFELPGMALFWMFGYMVLIALVVACAAVVWYGPRPVLLVAGGVAPVAPAEPLPAAKAQRHVTRRSAALRARPPVVAPLAAPVKQVIRDLTWPRRLRWIALAAVPSSLMLGLTTHVTTDIAAIPLFWIVPLALYLLSFILVFARWPVPWTTWPHRIFLYLQPSVLVLVGALAYGAVVPAMLILGVISYGMVDIAWYWPIVVLLVGFFVCVMVCHGELAKDRPPVQHLTEFYLWMSLGGVVGGLFNSLIAPVVFTQVIEFFLVLLLVPLLRPQTHFWAWIRGRPEPADDHSLQEYLLDIGYAVCLGLLGFALLRLTGAALFRPELEDFREWLRYRHGMNWNGTRPFYTADNFNIWLWTFYKARGMQPLPAVTWSLWTEAALIKGIPVAICLCFSGRPVRLGLAFIALVVASYVMKDSFQEETDTNRIIYNNRSFFGAQSIRYEENELGKYNVLIHGGIDHGRQNLEPTQVAGELMEAQGIYYFHPDNKRDQPISYFVPTNPIGQICMKLREMDSKPPFAVVGLGTGTLASYARKDQVLHIYEIDPAVLHLSEPVDGSKPYFHYLQDAKKRGVKLEVKLGDGRLKLRDAEEKYYQIIVLDAFSSDAVPAHLLTKDAITMYLTKLKDDGILIFNITNKYVRLAPVLADIAHDKELNLVCLKQADDSDRRIQKFGSDWVIMFRKQKADTPKMSIKAASAFGLLQPGLAVTDPWAGLGAVSEFDFQVPFPLQLDMKRWKTPQGAGRPPWTDSYQDLVRALIWGREED